ncbi:hypothetical protein CTI12_AA345380 [Artemisia annua]|uniref:Signal peptidase complex catalytic subunit SEC11 n=1 Tax=Artemisia annua TaxID=35608 RepID=A0A2U1MSW1_ARTAN|nr:hypothetical protein CTI12_AA345380 [Artemisia annua]
MGWIGDQIDSVKSMHFRQLFTQAISLGDNNFGDDRLLYAQGQMWLQRHHIMGRAVGYTKLPVVKQSEMLVDDEETVVAKMIKYLVEKQNLKETILACRLIKIRCYHHGGKYCNLKIMCYGHGGKWVNTYDMLLWTTQFSPFSEKETCPQFSQRIETCPQFSPFSEKETCPQFSQRIETCPQFSPFSEKETSPDSLDRMNLSICNLIF